MKIACAFVLLGGALAGAASPARASFQSPELPWKTRWMDLEITLLPDEGSLFVDGSLTLEVVVDEVEEVSIRMNSRAPAMQFREVGSSHDSKVTIERPDIGSVSRRATIHFDAPLTLGEEVEISFSIGNDGRQSSQFHVGEQVSVASWVEDWYPVAVPVGVPVTAHLAAAPGTTKFNLPTGWRALSNGIRIEHSDGGEVASEVWEVEQPVARSFAAGPYQVASHQVAERTVDVYRLSGNPEQAALQARGLARALSALETRFGAYPYPSCHLAEVPNFKFSWAASSEQGFVMANQHVFQYGENLGIFAHEASHGWWGNLVNTRGTGSILCSETLSQYGAVLAIETLEGPRAATEFLRFSRPGAVTAQCARGYFEIARRNQDVALSALSGQNSAHNLSDSKGPWVFHMLRRRVGDEVFFDTIREILHDFGGARLGLDDIRSRFRAAAPASASLDQFFRQWLDRTGAPHLMVSWKEIPEQEVEITIEQADEPYELWLDLEVRTDRGKATHRVSVEGARTVVRLPMEGSLEKVVFDPEHRLLLWRPEYGPPIQRPLAAPEGS